MVAATQALKLEEAAEKLTLLSLAEVNHKKASAYKDSLTKGYRLKARAILGLSLRDKSEDIPSWDEVKRQREKDGRQNHSH